PSRGAWIEIIRLIWPLPGPRVAPLAGSVDRNLFPKSLFRCWKVAPLAGSVDRNIVLGVALAVNLLSLPSRGAWIEIGGRKRAYSNAKQSLPSRGAWIEIQTSRSGTKKK